MVVIYVVARFFRLLTPCFYALFVIFLKIYYLLSNKLFINVLSLSDLMPRLWSHFALFFVTVTTEQINTTVILIYNNNHIYMQQPSMRSACKMSSYCSRTLDVDQCSLGFDFLFRTVFSCAAALLLFRTVLITLFCRNAVIVFGMAFHRIFAVVIACEASSVLTVHGSACLTNVNAK